MVCIPDTFTGEWAACIQPYPVMHHGDSAMPDSASVNGPTRLQQQQIMLTGATAMPDKESSNKQNMIPENIVND